jgi:hypothetical protein
MRDRLPYGLRGRRHWVEMLGVQRAEVNVCGGVYATRAKRYTGQVQLTPFLDKYSGGVAVSDDAHSASKSHPGTRRFS